MTRSERPTPARKHATNIYLYTWPASMRILVLKTPLSREVVFLIAVMQMHCSLSTRFLFQPRNSFLSTRCRIRGPHAYWGIPSLTPPPPTPSGIFDRSRSQYAISNSPRSLYIIRHPPPLKPAAAYKTPKSFS